MARIIASAVSLHAGPKPDSDVLTQLSGGDTFEVLELAGDHAWGVAPGQKLVGYVPASVLERPAA
ncbi:SH3 domain-containing protein [Sphingomonas sp. KR3-1]|uniref:SH3 domain-containing protein n=1 Tax=Sphingomonas sp. KR3-1 TaxID=3156611 RepID=UPI0032B5D899